MEEDTFRTADGQPVPSVTAAKMREVDRVAVEELGLSVLMMMEHAGRGLAEAVQKYAPDGRITVVAGGGGNGGGGLCAARHLVNHEREVDVVLDRPPEELGDAPARQWRVLGDAVTHRSNTASSALEEASVVIDALVGYGLQGAPENRLNELIELINNQPRGVVSLDVPAGVNATTGERPGVAVAPVITVTLALPKTGLVEVPCAFELVDLGIPPKAFERAGIDYQTPFAGGSFRVGLERAAD